MKHAMKHECGCVWMTVIRCFQFQSGHYEHNGVLEHIVMDGWATRSFHAILCLHASMQNGGNPAPRVAFCKNDIDQTKFITSKGRHGNGPPSYYA